MIEKNEYGIARWRINSEEERRLAQLADASVEGRSAYVAYYRENDTEYYEAGLPFIDRVLDRFGVHSVGEERRELIEDMIYSLHRFGFAFEEYFLLDLGGKSVEEREEYISDKVRYEYYARLNTSDGRRLLNDKAATLRRLGRYVGRDFLEVASGGGAQRDAIARFLSEHGDVVVKPLSECCGRGVSLFKEGEADADSILAALSTSGAVIEERIVQSPEMAAFHPESLNTVRMPCVMCRDGVHVITPFFRMGRGESVVDNAGAGGIFANVEAATGVLSTDGFDENGVRYPLHPDTGIAIKDARLPDWAGALHLVDELMLLVPENRYVGWDIAHTDGGWIVVEGNARGQFVMQFADKVGLRKEFERLIEFE